MKLYDLLFITNKYFSLIGWRDYCEIFFFSLLVYYISMWLAKDRKNNLLGIFYTCILIIFFAHTAQLPTVSNVIFLFSPALLMFFFMMHQHTLQKNFITLKTIPRQERSSPDCLETVVRSCLRSLESNRTISCLIEYTDQLESYISAPFNLQAAIHEKLFEFFIQSTFFDSNKMIWITSTGIVKSINADFALPNSCLLSDNQNNHNTTFKYKAGILTSRTDALVFMTNLHTRTFDVIVSGTHIEGISAAQMIPLLKKYYNQSHDLAKKLKSVNADRKGQKISETRI